MEEHKMEKKNSYKKFSYCQNGMNSFKVERNMVKTISGF